MPLKLNNLHGCARHTHIHFSNQPPRFPIACSPKPIMVCYQRIAHSIFIVAKLGSIRWISTLSLALISTAATVNVGSVWLFAERPFKRSDSFYFLSYSCRAYASHNIELKFMRTPPRTVFCIICRTHRTIHTEKIWKRNNSIRKTVPSRVLLFTFTVRVLPSQIPSIHPFIHKNLALTVNFPWIK